MFVDRCLPPNVAVGLNRFDEIHAVHMRDVYDLPEFVEDVQWLSDIGRAGWVGATQNFKIPWNPPEHDAIVRNATKVFSLSRADLPGLTQGLIFGRNLTRIYRREAADGGCFWRISERSPRRDIV